MARGQYILFQPWARSAPVYGVCTLQAMASGLPVIAYDYACANLHVQNGETGWLSGLGHQQGLIQQMLELPDLQRLQQMGAQARKKAEKVGWQYPVRQFEQALYLLVQQQEYRI